MRMNVFSKIFIGLLVGGIGVLSQILILYLLGNTSENSQIIARQSLIEILIFFVPAVILYGNDAYFQFRGNSFTTLAGYESFLVGYISRTNLLLLLFLIFLVSIGSLLDNSTIAENFALVCVALSSYYIYVTSFIYRKDISLVVSSTVERLFIFILSVLCFISFVFFDGLEYNNYLYFLIASSIFCISICFVLLSKKLNLFANCNFFEIDKSLSGRKKFFFFATSILVILFERGDQVIMLSLVGANLLANYFICFKISFITRMINGMFASLVYPVISRQFSVSKDGSSLYSTLMIATLVIFLLTATPLFVYMDVIASHFFEEVSSDVIITINILMFSVLVSSVNQIQSMKLSALGESEINFRIAIFGFFTQIISIYFLINIYGIVAIAIARCIASIVGFVIAYLKLSKESYVCKNSL